MLLAALLACSPCPTFTGMTCIGADSLADVLRADLVEPDRYPTPALRWAEAFARACETGPTDLAFAAALDERCATGADPVAEPGVAPGPGPWNGHRTEAEGPDGATLRAWHAEGIAGATVGGADGWRLSTECGLTLSGAMPAGVGEEPSLFVDLPSRARLAI